MVGRTVLLIKLDMRVNLENKATYEKKVMYISNGENTFMNIGDINTGLVRIDIINKMFNGLPSKSNTKKIILVISDYGEFVEPLKDIYGDDCEIYCVPTTHYGFEMCKLSLSVYVNNPENFVIFDRTKLQLLGFGREYFEYIMKSKRMKFDIGVANPPYGSDGVGTNKKLHFDIMEVCLSMCDKVNFIMPSKCLYDEALSTERKMLRENGCYKVEIQDKSIFPNTQMPPTAIYFCDKSCGQYDERLGEDIYVANNFFKNDIEEYIYNIFNTGNTMFKHTLRIDGKVSEEDKIFDNICKKLNKYKYFINVSYANYGMNGEWIAQNDLKNAGVKNLDEEIDFILNISTPKFVIRLNSETSANNLYNLLQSKLMKFCLWILQDDRNMKQKVYKLFPDIDYENIYNNRDLLRAIKCDESKIEDILNYVESFDFTEKRENRFLQTNN